MRQGTDRPDISERLNGAHAPSDYDALADLFLGSAPSPSPSPATIHTDPAQSPPALGTRTAPAATEDLGTPHGPCCSRVGPIGGAATAKPAARRIEILVLGHLPGLGGTWAAQQARALAQHAASPVCLLRLTADQLVVDLIWPDDARPTVFPACHDGASALRLAAQYAGSWLLRVHALDESIVNEWFAHPTTGHGTDSAADRVRLLTGADDPAIVAAYRRLKAWHAASAGSAHAFARLARVTIVEPDAARAHAAEARLRKAAASFLETELAPAERLGAMRPVRVTTLYCGPFDANASHTLALLRTISSQVPLASAPAQEPVPVAAASANPARSSTSATSLNAPTGAPSNARSEPAVRPIERPHAVAASSRNGSPSHHTHASDAPSNHAPSNNSSANPANVNGAHASIPRHAPTTDQLIAMVARSAGIDTLRAAQTSCPWAPAIVLAADLQGEFHAIAFADDDAHVAHATVDLLAASRWCTEHASLLAMASVTPRAIDTTLHLITTAPAAARRLADTGLRVHAAVRVGDNWGAVAIG